MGNAETLARQAVQELAGDRLARGEADRVHKAVVPFGPGFLHLREQALDLGVVADIATAVGGLLLSIPVARAVLAPVRRMLHRYEPVTQRPLLGRYAEVRSPEITQSHGTAWVDDGGAGLILQVRADVSGRFVRGDRVVLIEYLEEQNAYRVISGGEFEQL